MNEFSLIGRYFKSIQHQRHDVIFGIGDDAACVRMPPNHELLISNDTLVEGIHFLNSWNPYDIAYKACMVNISDIAAMGASPAWVMLSLTMPKLDTAWLDAFSKGLSEALHCYQMALIGGDTTKGPLAISLTILGYLPFGKAVKRSGACVGDTIFVSGPLGAAGLAVANLEQQAIADDEAVVLQTALTRPTPRVDLNLILQNFAHAAIDISDGLCADLNHICEASQVSACLDAASIPIHPLVQKLQPKHALDFALTGGDDYELCFTVSAEKKSELLEQLRKMELRCYPIGVIEPGSGLKIKQLDGTIIPLSARGYSHF